jgi:hypothetical protein
MARESKNNNLPPIIEAYQQWIKKCLIADGSLFSSTKLWTPELVEEVREAFVDHPDMGKEDSFWDKLKKQMQNASTSAKQLMAEMIWAMLTFPCNINADTKRDCIREVWSFSGQVLSEKLPLLSDDVLDGIGSGGQGYLTGYWRELTFIIKLVVDLKKRSQPLRADAVVHRLDDHLVFLNWRQSADAGVIGVTLVVRGDEAVGFGFSQILQGEITKVSVLQHIFSRQIFLRIHHQRFHQPDLWDGTDNRLEPIGSLLLGFNQPHRQNVFQCQPDFSQLKSNFHFAHDPFFV